MVIQGDSVEVVIKDWQHDGAESLIRGTPYRHQVVGVENPLETKEPTDCDLN